MGHVIVVFKVIPDDVDTFESVKAEVQKLNPQRLEEEPIAFGLNSVKATFLVPEVDGKMDELEEQLNSIEHVGGVEVMHMSRSL